MNWRDAEEGPENREQRQERLLTAAVGVLLGDRDSDTVKLQRRFGMELVAEAERAVRRIAKDYRWQAAAHARSVSFTEAVESLEAAETACARLVTALDNLGPDARNILLGLGPMGVPFRNMGWDLHARRHLAPDLDFATLAGIVGRYAVPDSSSPPAAEALRDTHRRTRKRAEELANLRRQLWSQQGLASAGVGGRDSDARAKLAERIDRLEKANLSGELITWSEGIEAFREYLKTIRLDYKHRFHAEVFKLERDIEYGSSRNLKAGRVVSKGKSEKLKRLNGPAPKASDGGSGANMFELQYGRPDQNLANECYECFTGYNKSEEISTLIAEPFGMFVVAVLKYAINSDELPSEDGINHCIRKAIGIGEQLIDLAKRTGHLTEEEISKLDSLRLARARGTEEKPVWMSNRPRKRKKAAINTKDENAR